jgi:hypothetical protein
MLGIKINEVIKDRDNKLIAQYCQEGAFMDEHGKVTGGVCKHVDFSELLNEVHLRDAVLLDAVKACIVMERNKHDDPKVRTALNNILADFGS